MTLIKICGLRQWDTVQWLAQARVPYGGFVFAPSKRRVQPEDAQAWMAAVVPCATQFVGVVGACNVDALDALLRAAPLLHAVQFHGPPDPTLHAFAYTNYPHIQRWQAISYDGHAYTKLDACPSFDVLLLDAPRAGSGIPFDWSVIPQVRAWTRVRGCRLFVAGGLDADNVGQLVSAYDIDGVDVSSGIERDGKQCTARIAAFVDAATKQPRTRGERT
ncbi:MAG: phosphoribosylanthranilate isomerase [Paenibacillaceae bacterium]|nr:phosphoribosylanthranilate isomerase [Paenibacillaceae bacterium]